MIKEGLDDALSPASRDLEWSRTLGRASYEVMWSVAPYYRDLILESNFYPSNEEHRRQILRLHARPVEVFCWCPVDEARRRYVERAQQRHPVHVATDLEVDRFRDWEQPMGLGPVIMVNTRGPVDVGNLAEQVLRTL